MIHSQKVAFIEGCPAGWPEGWAFGPGKPVPPGWETREYPETVLAAGTSGVNPVGLEVYALDRHAEDTDILSGQILIIRAFDDKKMVRLRLSEAQPWSEALWLKMGEYEVGKFGINRKVFVDRRSSVDAIRIACQVYASTLDTEVNA